MGESEERVWNGRLPPEVPKAWNKLTEAVIGCAMEVHSILGPGLLERLYEDAMAYELSSRRIDFERQAPVVLRYKSIDLSGQRLHLVVGGLVVVELKSIESVPNIHLAQLTSYLRSADLPLGLLLNFNVPHMRDGIYRQINLISVKRRTQPASSSPSAFSPAAISSPLSSNLL